MRKTLCYSAFLATAALSAVVVCWTNSALATLAPATKPSEISTEIVMTDLSLQQGILEPTEQAAGTTAIRSDTMMLNISSIHLIDRKPAAIIKEPVYTGKPRYGAFQIGNGPKSITYFVVDDAKGPAGKVYVDRNQNGDLTDDGPGNWDHEFEKYGQFNQTSTITVHASWGTPVEETESGEYTLSLAHYYGAKGLGFYRTTGRTGSMRLGGKVYPIVLGESSGDGIFTVPADADLTRHPEMLYIDLKGAAAIDVPPPVVDPTNKHSFAGFNLAHPFEVDGHWYFARPSISGAKLKAQETNAPGEPARQPASPSQLSIGDPAPNFTVQTPQAKPMSLADFKGKVVILDFWATWCGPCQASMPGLEKLYQKIKDQNIVVLSVNVDDEKVAFDRWIGIHANKDYHFTFGFDPAGRGKNSVADSTYRVYAIPAMFVIAPDGKIVQTMSGDDEDKLVKALVSQGIKVHQD